LLEWLIELRERIYSLLLVYYIGYLKDKNGQPDEVHRIRSGRFPCAGI